MVVPGKPASSANAARSPGEPVIVRSTRVDAPCRPFSLAGLRWKIRFVHDGQTAIGELLAQHAQSARRCGSADRHVPPKIGEDKEAARPQDPVDLLEKCRHRIYPCDDSTFMTMSNDESRKGRRCASPVKNAMF